MTLLFIRIHQHQSLHCSSGGRGKGFGEEDWELLHRLSHIIMAHFFIRQHQPLRQLQRQYKVIQILIQKQKKIFLLSKLSLFLHRYPLFSFLSTSQTRDPNVVPESPTVKFKTGSPANCKGGLESTLEFIISNGKLLKLA